jgi:hypothetical protein
VSSRNITLALPDELIRRARVLAAERETSVSALVASLLAELVGEVDDYERLWAEEEEAMAAGALVVGDVTWSRDQVHER